MAALITSAPPTFRELTWPKAPEIVLVALTVFATLSVEALNVMEDSPSSVSESVQTANWLSAGVPVTSIKLPAHTFASISSVTIDEPL